MLRMKLIYDIEAAKANIEVGEEEENKAKAMKREADEKETAGRNKRKAGEEALRIAEAELKKLDLEQELEE